MIKSPSIPDSNTAWVPDCTDYSVRVPDCLITRYNWYPYLTLTTKLDSPVFVLLTSYNIVPLPSKHFISVQVPNCAPNLVVPVPERSLNMVIEGGGTHILMYCQKNEYNYKKNFPPLNKSSVLATLFSVKIGVLPNVS